MPRPRRSTLEHLAALADAVEMVRHGRSANEAQHRHRLTFEALRDALAAAGVRSCPRRGPVTLPTPATPAPARLSTIEKARRLVAMGHRAPA